jgi:hypothetical protein
VRKHFRGRGVKPPPGIGTDASLAPVGCCQPLVFKRNREVEPGTDSLVGAERVGEFTVYKKGWLATLHRNPVKNLILFSYLPTQSASTNLP